MSDSCETYGHRGNSTEKRPSARKLRAGLVFEQVHRTGEIIIKVLFKNFNTKYIIYILNIKQKYIKREHFK